MRSSVWAFGCLLLLAGGEAMVRRFQAPLQLTDEQRVQLVPIFADNLQARSEQMRSEMRGSMRSRNR